MDQLPWLGKRELIFLLLFTCNYVVSVWRGFLFLWVLGMGYVMLLWHSLSLPYNYFLKTPSARHAIKWLFKVQISSNPTTCNTNEVDGLRPSRFLQSLQYFQWKFPLQIVCHFSLDPMGIFIR